LSDAELIAALPESENVVVVDAATTWDRPDVFVKVTPVEALHAAPLSEVMVPFPVAVVIVTGKAFGLLTEITTSWSFRFMLCLHG
jgi:hypothetical protein